MKDLFYYIKSRFWEPSGPGRYRGMDTLRGICCVLMAGFHLVYALVSYHGTPYTFLYHPAVTALQILSSRGFILLAGMACRLSRSNVRRGVFTLACSLAVSLVSLLWGDPIRFGILHFMGCAAILYGLTAKWVEKIPPVAGIVASLLLYTICRQVFPLSVSVGGLFPFGLVAPGFRSSDYYPLLPYFFWFLTGSYTMTWLSHHPKIKKPLLEQFHLPLLEGVGRNALLFYALHQPVIIGALALIL